MNPLIFLDFDGVLIGDDFRPTVPVRHLDPSRIDMLNTLVRLYNCHIVLTTAWRHPMGLTQEIVDVLVRDGLKEPERIIGQTPYLPGQSRSAEIRAWLDQNWKGTPNFVILDDLEMDDLRHLLVRCDPKVGFSDEDAIRAIQILSGAGWAWIEDEEDKGAA